MKKKLPIKNGKKCGKKCKRRGESETQYPKKLLLRRMPITIIKEV